MANSSLIEWTDASWNPATGCDKISEGCKNCYAEEQAEHLQRMGQKKYVNGFKYTEHVNALEIPLHWKKPKKIFVNSMSDLFHEMATDGFISQVFLTMIKAPWHTYQILTKRPARMKEFIIKWLSDNDLTKVPDWIWIGVTCESDLRTDRIDILRSIPANKRFVSFEPLLGFIKNVNLQFIDWMIIGGESGHGARPMKIEWVRDLIQNGKKYDTKIFFKQMGGNNKCECHGSKGCCLVDGVEYKEFPERGKM